MNASVPSWDLAPWRGIRDMSGAKKIDTSFLGHAPKGVIAVPIFGMRRMFCIRSWRSVFGRQLRYALDGCTFYRTGDSNRDKSIAKSFPCFQKLLWMT